MPQVRQSAPGPKMFCFECVQLTAPELRMDSALFDGPVCPARALYPSLPTYAEANVGQPSSRTGFVSGDRSYVLPGNQKPSDRQCAAGSRTKVHVR